MTYDVTFVNEATGQQDTVAVTAEDYIFDIAEMHGVELPASCRAGACISCVGKVIRGEIEHDRAALSTAEEQAGFMLTCCAYARSNCTILINQEEALLDFNPNA